MEELVRTPFSSTLKNKIDSIIEIVLNYLSLYPLLFFISLIIIIMVISDN